MKNKKPTKAKEIEWAEKFCALLLKHAKLKANLYDGSTRPLEVDLALRFATEELGEVATAITRGRWLQAEAECIDLAHTAMLVWISLKRKGE